MALSDDVSGAVGTTVSKTGEVVGGTVRGGLLGAAATFVAGSLGLGAASAIGAAAGTGVTAAVAGTVTGAAFMLSAGLPLIIAGAVVGAALLGLGSLLPGVSDVWNGAKKMMHRHHDEPDTQVIVEHHHYEYPAPAPQPKRIIVCDNPDFQPGRGAAILERSNTAQPGTDVCR